MGTAIIALLLTFQEAGQQVDQQVLASRIQGASLEERWSAVAQVASIEPAKRTRAVRQALADELARLNRLVRKRASPAHVIESEWDTADLREYLPLVLKANADSGDIASLEPLIGALATGNMAARAIERYGAVAFDPLLRELRDTSTESVNRSGAARVLGQLLANGRHDARQRRELIRIVNVILTRPEPYVVVVSVAELAVLTSDAKTIALVEGIADGAAQLSDGDASLRDQIQLRAKRALDARQQ